MLNMPFKDQIRIIFKSFAKNIKRRYEIHILKLESKELFDALIHERINGTNGDEYYIDWMSLETQIITETAFIWGIPCPEMSDSRYWTKTDGFSHMTANGIYKLKKEIISQKQLRLYSIWSWSGWIFGLGGLLIAIFKS